MILFEKNKANRLPGVFYGDGYLLSPECTTSPDAIKKPDRRSFVSRRPGCLSTYERPETFCPPLTEGLAFIEKRHFL
jgi:hypothetical protein